MRGQELLRVKITQQLEAEIKTKKWDKGAMMPTEAELCKQFNVSRVTVRAALQALESRGYIKTVQGSGTVVISSNPVSQLFSSAPDFSLTENSKLISILEFRMIFEKGVAGIAAKRITNEEIVQLEKTYTDMLANVNNVSQFSRSDLSFHTQLCEATKNPFIIQSFESLKQFMELAMTNIVSIMGSAVGLKYHKLLIAAMKNHDSAEAEKQMEAHVQITIDGISQFLLFQKED